jgi:hypothetical protein
LEELKVDADAPGEIHLVAILEVVFRVIVNCIELNEDVRCSLLLLAGWLNHEGSWIFEDIRVLLKASIRDDKPVVFLENEMMHAVTMSTPGHIMDKDFLLPPQLGKGGALRHRRDYHCLLQNGWLLSRGSRNPPRKFRFSCVVITRVIRHLLPKTKVT